MNGRRAKLFSIIAAALCTIACLGGISGAFSDSSIVNALAKIRFVG